MRKSLEKVHIRYFASTGPNASHFGHTVSIHDLLKDAKEAIAKRPNGWVYAIIRGEDTMYKGLGRKLIDSSDAQTEEYANQYCAKINR